MRGRGQCARKRTWLTAQLLQQSFPLFDIPNVTVRPGIGRQTTQLQLLNTRQKPGVCGVTLRQELIVFVIKLGTVRSEQPCADSRRCPAGGPYGMLAMRAGLHCGRPPRSQGSAALGSDVLCACVQHLRSDTNAIPRLAPTPDNSPPKPGSCTPSSGIAGGGGTSWRCWDYTAVIRRVRVGGFVWIRFPRIREANALWGRVTLCFASVIVVVVARAQGRHSLR